MIIFSLQQQIDQKKIGILLSYVNIAAKILINFLYMPVLLKYLSKDQYGLYQLLWSLSGFLAIADFGFSTAVIRYYSAARKNRNKEKLKEILLNACSIYTVLTIILILCGIALYFFAGLTYGAKLNAKDMATMQITIPIMILMMSIGLPSTLLTALISAHEHFIFLKTSALLYIIAQPIISIFALKFIAANIPTLVCAETLNIVLITLLNLWYCIHYLKIKPVPSLSFTPMKNEMIKFSFFMFTAFIADKIIWSSGQAVLGAMSGNISITFYSLSFYLAFAFSTIPFVISELYLPAFSAAASSNNMPKIQKLFQETGKLQFRVLLLFLGGFIFLGKDFIQIWLGTGYEKCFTLTSIILAGFLPDFMLSAGLPAVQALNKHGKRSVILLITSILAILLEIFLSYKYDEYGCACAISIMLFLGYGIATGIYYSKLGLGIKKYFAGFIRPFIASLPAFALFFIILDISPIGGIKGFIIHGIMLTVLYSISALIFGLDDIEKERLRKHISSWK